MSLQADSLSGRLLPQMPDISRLSQKNERGVSGKTRGRGAEDDESITRVSYPIVLVGILPRQKTTNEG